ncbi:MAG: hypothetical protein H7Z16_10755 [Pyrinomonadaceae bacterium]|nr:hypothetical protein [Pyrinomonadaceae bacterium]
MTNGPGNLEGQLHEYSAQLKSLKSYLKELSDTCAHCGTDRALFERDLLEAEHNVQYYEGEIARLKEEIEGSNVVKPGSLAKPGLLSLVLTPISFLAGALLGSKLKSRK